MSYDVDFRDFRHTFEIVVALKLTRNYLVECSLVDVKWRQTVAGAARLRALEDQLLVGTEVSCDFSDVRIQHNQTRDLSPALSASICSRVFVSVTQTKKSFGRLESKRESAMPPSMPFCCASLSSNGEASVGARTTNSLKNGPEKGSEKPSSFPISRAA